MTSSKYIHDNFFLKSNLAVRLYHSVAKQLPMIDYHNHLNPGDLASNRKFRNIADAWVLHDPYKHRAMRICGVPEDGITGNATEKEKFLNWAATVPKTPGNPLFFWSALELKRIFGIDDFLTEKNAGEIWDFCNVELEKEDFGAVDILKKFGAEILCTSDDLLGELSWHQLATNKQQIEVYPSLRGDSAVNIEQPDFMEWLGKLETQTNQTIQNIDRYKSAILSQLDKFSKAGCKLADHSLDSDFQFTITTEKKAAEIFSKKLDGGTIDKSELFQFKNHILNFLGTEYSQRGWTLQLHIGAQRFTSSRLRRLSGPAGGYGAIGNLCDITGLCLFFDELEKKGDLPRIILYTLNPCDNEAFATLTGSFAEDGVPGKIQFGPAWWYNDHFDGITKHISNLSSYGLLSQFIGMTTDSRSIFSFSRHEYFRRILCNHIAEMVDRGSLPNDFDTLSKIVEDVSYYNSKKFIFHK